MTGLVMLATTNALMWITKLPKKIMLFGNSEYTMSAMETAS